jgi:hypothetical protein
MVFWRNDRYWDAVRRFLEKRFSKQAAFLTLPEFMEVFSGVYPYDVVHTYEHLQEMDAVVVHKNRMEEIARPVLEALAREYVVVFANRKFAIFCRPGRLRWAGVFPKWWASGYRRRLRDILARAPESRSGKTVILVTTYERPHFLRRTLEDLVRLQAPILVVDDASREKFAEAYRQIFAEFPVEVLRMPSNRGVANAINAGVGYWLADPQVEWISYFQDDVEVRPDVFDALARHQDPDRQPILSGRLDPLHPVQETREMKGEKLYFQRSCPGVHLHAHRSYWEDVLPIPTPYLGAPKKAEESPRPGRGADEDFWITCWSPLSVAKDEGFVCVVPGLVRTISVQPEESTWGATGQAEAPVRA